MRPVLLFVVLLSISQLCLSVSLEEAIDNYTEENEQVSVRVVETTFGSFRIVSVSSVDVLVLSESDGYAPVVSSGAIENVLRAEFFSKLNATERVSDIYASVLSFNSSRAPEEQTCLQYTGNDRYPCLNSTQCQYACISVPLCKSVMNGVGDQFTTSIVSWRLGLLLLDQHMQDFVSLVPLLEQGDSNAFVRASSSLQGLESQATAITKNKMFSCDPKDIASYCFCPDANYTYSDLSVASAKLASFKSDYAQLASLYSYAQRISAETARRIHDAEIRGARGFFLRMAPWISSNASAAEQSAVKTLGVVKDVELQGMLNDLRALNQSVFSKAQAEDYEGALNLADALLGKALDTESRSSTVYGQYYSLITGSTNFSNSLVEFSGSLLDSENYYAASAQMITANFTLFQQKLAPPIEYSLLSQLRNELLSFEVSLSSLRTLLAEKREMDVSINETRLQVAQVSSRALLYKQPFDGSGLLLLLEEASNYSSLGNIALARSSLTTCQIRLAASNASIENQIVRIDSAFASLESANQTLSEISERRFLFLAPNMQDSNAALAEAYSVVYANPGAAEQKASESVSLAYRASRSVEPGSLFGCIGALLLFSVLASAMACAGTQR